MNDRGGAGLAGLSFPRQSPAACYWKRGAAAGRSRKTGARAPPGDSGPSGPLPRAAFVLVVTRRWAVISTVLCKTRSGPVSTPARPKMCHTAYLRRRHFADPEEESAVHSGKTRRPAGRNCTRGRAHDGGSPVTLIKKRAGALRADAFLSRQRGSMQDRIVAGRRRRRSIEGTHAVLPRGIAHVWPVVLVEAGRILQLVLVDIQHEAFIDSVQP